MSENNLDHLSNEDKSELMKNIEKARQLLGKGTKIIIKSPTGENTFEEDLTKQANEEIGPVSNEMSSDLKQSIDDMDYFNKRFVEVSKISAEFIGTTQSNVCSKAEERFKNHLKNKK